MKAFTAKVGCAKKRYIDMVQEDYLVKEGHLYTNVNGTTVVHAFEIWEGGDEVFIDFCVVPGSKLECLNEGTFLRQYPRVVDRIVIVEE